MLSKKPHTICGKMLAARWDRTSIFGLWPLLSFLTIASLLHASLLLPAAPRRHLLLLRKAAAKVLPARALLRPKNPQNNSVFFDKKKMKNLSDLRGFFMRRILCSETAFLRGNNIAPNLRIAFIAQLCATNLF